MSSAADAALASQSRVLSAIHELGFRLASPSSQVDVRDFAVEYLMSLAGVRAAWFSE